jgi:glycosyltransferase involved in cell wall biosynthesis
VSSPLSIVQVNSTNRGGGAAGVARALNDGYTRRGHRARLLVGTCVADGEGGVKLRNGRGAWAAHDRLRDQHWPRAAKVARAIASPSSAVDVVFGREEFRFPSTRTVERAATSADILQLHNLHGDYFDLRALPRLAACVPVVLSPQDAWLTTGHCAHTLGCERWRTGCGRCPHLRVYPALRRDGTAGNWQRKADLYAQCSLAVAVPSKWLGDAVADSILGPAIRELRVIPNGVDLGTFHPGDKILARSKLDLEPSGKVLVFAAEGIAKNDFKDYDTFVRALELLGSTFEEPITAVALGAARPAIRNLGNVVLREVPSVPLGRVATWLRAADIYVHAARADTFPLAVLEALACGVPVVASSVGGIPEQIEETTGLLVPPGCVADLRDAMAMLLSDVERRTEMGHAAAVDAVRRFGIDRQVAAYLELFMEMTADREQRSG